jgi:aspartate/glutamate racemase
MLSAGIDVLQGLGAQTIVVCTSRAQSEFEITPSCGSIQLMADVVVAAVLRLGCRRIGLLGASQDAEERFCFSQAAAASHSSRSARTAIMAIVSSTKSSPSAS